MKGKIKIYLCDFVHNYLGVGTYMFPLNIGYIAAYAYKFFPNDLDIRLFKYPDDFIAQFKKTPPEIAGFSHYTWNADINNKLSQYIKSFNPDTLVVFGGPNIDYSDTGKKQFFNSYAAADFYIPYQGETPFINLLKDILNCKNLSVLRPKAIDGILFYDRESDTLIQGRDVGRIKDLDIIPSPYLAGLLDQFFAVNLIPILETNRGCPYTCTFCAQGVFSHNQLDFFNLERIKEELKYIAERSKNVNILCFADSNFGIVERDIEIAEYIAKLKKETGYPRRFYSNWAKNQPKIFEIAQILDCANPIISLQSLNETVLRNVKRTNIQLSLFKDFIDKVNVSGGMCGTEIILGLPGETKESHLNTIRELFEWDTPYMTCYNALLLKGTEMSLLKETGKLQCHTKFRLIDNSFGEYAGIKSFETEEGIRSLDTISEEEILFFRPIHWLIQFLWNYRFYYDLLKFLKSLEINPLDYIMRLLEEGEQNSAPAGIRKIFRDFNEEAREEWFDSPEKLTEYYRGPERFKILQEGQYGKLNGKYIFKVLIDLKEEFNAFLYRVAINCSDLCKTKEEVFRDLLRFISESVIDFKANWDEIEKEREFSCKFDILGWRDSRYEKKLEDYYYPDGIKFIFSLPREQKRALEILLKQYGHKNRNVTFRKMSEFMDIRDLFYKTALV